MTLAMGMTMTMRMTMMMIMTIYTPDSVHGRASTTITNLSQSTVPNLKGDPKYSERGPDFEQKGDLKGTKKGDPKLGLFKKSKRDYILKF